MDILRNGKKIGHNKYSFENQNNLLVVKNEINFVAKLVGINLLVVKGSSTETYKSGKFTTLSSIIMLFCCLDNFLPWFLSGI